MKKLRPRKRKILAVVFVAFLGFAIEETIAVSNNRSIFNNLFGLATYQTTATEVFSSPSNWMTCETTEKIITVRNDGDLPVAARVKIEESWQDVNDNELSLTFVDETGNIQKWAVMNINTDDWTREGGYYYYKSDLDTGETSTPFMTGVTLNCDANLDGTAYNGADYTLSATIQTIDAEHQDIWASTATLALGETLDLKFKKLSGTDSPALDTINTNIKTIREADSLPKNLDITNPDNIISADGSEPIYAWFDDADGAGAIYIYSGAQKIKGGVDMRYIFAFCEGLESAPAVSNWNTSDTVYFSSIFWDTKSLKSIDLSDWDTSKAIIMYGLFAFNSSLTSLDLSSWDVSKVDSMYGMFAYNESLTSINLTGWDTGSVTNMSCMFMNDTSLTSLDLSGWDVSNVRDMAAMFQLSKNLVTINLTGWTTTNLTDMASMFSVGDEYVGNGKLKEIIGLGSLDVSKVKDMTCLFYGAGNMTSYDISGWDMSNVESLNHMFCDNFKLKSLDLSGWDVGKVKTMYNMFDDARALTTIGDVSHWDTKSLIDVGGWLNGASSFVGDNGTLDLSGWDTSSLKAAGEMFRATKLVTIDLTGWDFSEATNANWEGSGEGIYYETGNRSSYKGLAGMFLNASKLQTVYLSQDGKDSYDAAVSRGVKITDMWKGAQTSDFTIKPEPGEGD